MRRHFTLLCALLLFLAKDASGQQDPMFTKYMFNSMVFNPAYAGSMGYGSARVLYRNQWFKNIEGAPITQTFTFHTPMGERVGLGVSAANDKIGPVSSTVANLVYAYHVPFKDGKIAVGLQAGLMYWRADWGKLDIREPGDGVFEADMQPSFWLPNFGVGVYYYSDLFYVGISAPHLINHDLRKKVSQTTPDILKWAKLYSHYYLTAGAAFPINDAIVLKPSLLIKNVGFFSDFTSNVDGLSSTSAPTEIDLDASVLFYNTLWVGAAFRTAIEATSKNAKGNPKSSVDSADLWAAYYLKNGLRIGMAYDYPLTELNTVTPGSFELMLGYDFSYQVEKVVTPRYF
jgi:type IX secretion system PorP/SprF family membrane protein